MAKPEAIVSPIRSQPLNDWYAYLDSEKLGKKELHYVNVMDYGAVGDGIADDAPAIQAAINALGSGGIVVFPVGVYAIYQDVIINNLVMLQGVGYNVSIIKIGDGAIAEIKSEGFDSLTGTNTWLYSAGVPVNFGLKHIGFYGNRDNRTGGDGVKFYGKNFRLDHVLIYNMPGNGLYTECADIAAAQNEFDLPESTIERLYIRGCNGNGWLFRGSHDSYADKVYVSECGGYGFKSETVNNKYGGKLAGGHMHIYSNGSATMEPGTIIEASFDLDYLETEANFGPGLRITDSNVRIGYLKTYNNFRAPDYTPAANYADHEIEIDNRNHTVAPTRISQIHSQAYREGFTILFVRGQQFMVDQANIDGNGLDVSGIDFAGNFAKIDGKIRGCSGTNSVGLKLGDGNVNLTDNYINLSIASCTTQIKMQPGPLFSYRNSGLIQCYNGTATTKLLDGPWPTRENGNYLELTAGDNTEPNETYTHFSGRAYIDMTSTTLQTVSFSHKMIQAPDIGNVQATLSAYHGQGDFTVQFLSVWKVTSTEITVRFKLSEPSSDPAGDINVSAFI